MAEMTAASINDLPDSDFAYIEPGGKVVDGKTEPRSLRHFPIHDAAHVRNALARLDQSPFGDKARAKVEAAAKWMGIGEPAGKAFTEMKAENLSETQLDRWLKGLRSRAVLVMPFGGTLPRKGAPLGADLDGEWFDAETDRFGPYPYLRETNRRIVDWHHDNDPTGVMKGAVLGHIELDEDPESEGLWAQFWINAGEKRKQLFAALEASGQALYGSSQAVFKKANEATGHIDVWPLIRHTMTTSPQNRLAVVPPLKALLTAPSIDEMPADALKALLVGLDASTTELLLSSSDAVVTAPALIGDEAVKAGRVLSAKNLNDLQAAIGLLSDLLSRGVLLSSVDQEET
jgi:hypothetical protein